MGSVVASGGQEGCCPLATPLPNQHTPTPLTFICRGSSVSSGGQGGQQPPCPPLDALLPIGPISISDFFLFSCENSLHRNRDFIGLDQKEYQRELERNYRSIEEKLSPLISSNVATLRKHKHKRSENVELYKLKLIVKMKVIRHFKSHQLKFILEKPE